jgi:hypothetical protein
MTSLLDQQIPLMQGIPYLHMTSNIGAYRSYRMFWVRITSLPYRDTAELCSRSCSLDRVVHFPITLDGSFNNFFPQIQSFVRRLLKFTTAQ